jgi:hypothetical protein
VNGEYKTARYFSAVNHRDVRGVGARFLETIPIKSLDMP